MKHDIWVFFEKSDEKIRISLKYDKNDGVLYMKNAANLYECLAEF